MTLTKWVFWPDTHDPWHDVRAVSIAMDIVTQYRPHGFCFLGDYHDAYSASRFDKHPDRMFASLRDEICDGIELRNSIVTNSKAKKIVFLEGNHEFRIQKYIWNNAPLLHHYIHPKAVLEIPRKWQYISYGQKGFYKIDRLAVFHGFKHNKQVASTMLTDMKCSVLFAHTHRYQVACQRHFFDGPLFSYNVGWLGNAVKAADYCKVPPDWVHMITLGWFSKNHFQIQPIFINNKGVLDGKIFTSN